MEHDTRQEALTELVTQPFEVFRSGGIRLVSRLHFDADDRAGADLGEEVELLSSLLYAQVVEARPAIGEYSLSPQLRCDERLEHAAEEVPFAQYCVVVDADRTRYQARIERGASARG